MSYKFIIDTNVLDEVSTEKLRAAGILSACSSGRFAFYVTPILLKERLHFAAEGRINPRAIEPIKLLTNLKWQRLFNEFGGTEGIFAKELEGKFRCEYLFIGQKMHKENLKLFLVGGEFDNEAKRILLSELSQWREKKENNKKVYLEMRHDITEKIKNNNSASRKGADFKAFLKINFEPEAIDKIKNRITSKASKEQLVKYWKTHMVRCPYFNKYIEGYLFIAWYAMASEQDPVIDINAQGDIEHLLYLIDVDGIISNEKGFLKIAYQNLFPGKELLSVEEFIMRIKNETTISETSGVSH